MEGTQPQDSNAAATGPGRVTSFSTQPSGSRSAVIAHGRREQTINVKIIQAKMKLPRSASGKPQFVNLNVLYIDVTEATANITYLTNAVRAKWGNDHVIVTSEGLPISDGSGTQGKYKHH